MSRETVNPRVAFGSGATIAKGGAIWVFPQPLPRPRIVAPCITSTTIPANTLIIAPLALPAGTRYNTSGLERRSPLAGFGLSTYGRV